MAQSNLNAVIMCVTAVFKVMTSLFATEGTLMQHCDMTLYHHRLIMLAVLAVCQHHTCNELDGVEQMQVVAERLP